MSYKKEMLKISGYETWKKKKRATDQTLTANKQAKMFKFPNKWMHKILFIPSKILPIW